MEYSGKYFFESTVRTNDGNVVPQIFGYDTLDSAEIKYHNEVAYGLQLNTLVLAHYEVKNEYGVVMHNLTSTIDRTAENSIEEA